MNVSCLNHDLNPWALTDAWYFSSLYFTWIGSICGAFLFRCMPKAVLHQYCKMTIYCTHKTTVFSISATSEWVSACERYTNQCAFFKFQAEFHWHKLVCLISRSVFRSPLLRCSCFSNSLNVQTIAASLSDFCRTSSIAVSLIVHVALLWSSLSKLLNIFNQLNLFCLSHL